MPLSKEDSALFDQMMGVSTDAPASVLTPEESAQFDQEIPPTPHEPTAIAGPPLGSAEEGTFGTLQNVANDYLLGQGLKIPAFFAAFNGPDTFGENYDYALRQLQGRREAYAQREPGKALASAVLASAPVTAAAIAAGQEYAAAPMLAQVARVAPGLARFVSGAAQGNKLVQLASRATAGAGQGAAVGAIQSGMNPDQGVGQQMLTGATVLGALNPALSYLVPGIKNLLNAPVTRAAARQAQGLEANQIEVMPSQITASPEVKHIAANLGVGSERQLGDATQTVNEMMGIHGEREFSPERLAQQKKALGLGFEQVADRIPHMGDVPLLKDLQAVWDDVRTTGSDAQINQFGRIISNLADHVQNGTLNGNVFREYTRTASARFKALTSGDNYPFGSKIVSALYDALDRNAPADDIATLKRLKNQYAVLKTVEPMVQKGATVLNPSQFVNAASGVSQLSDLSHAVKLLKDVKPNQAGGTIQPSTRANKLIETGLDLLRHPAARLAEAGAAGYALPKVAATIGEFAGIPEASLLHAGTAGLAAFLGRTATNAMQKRLLGGANADYLRQLYIARGLGKALPAQPLSVTAYNALTQSLPRSAAVALYNRGQE